MSIMIRHYSHRILVFGDYDGTYCTSITRCYITYSSSIVISLITNHVLVTYFFFTHIQAWVITMLWTVRLIANRISFYVIVKCIVCLSIGYLQLFYAESYVERGREDDKHRQGER